MYKADLCPISSMARPSTGSRVDPPVEYRRRILWIDDEPDIVRPLVEFLESRGCAVDMAASGAVGLQRAQSSSYDAILLDLRMPGFSGMQVLHALRDRGVESHVIIVTAYPTSDSAFAAGKLGAVAYCSKPIRGTELLRRIDALRSDARSAASRGKSTAGPLIGTPAENHPGLRELGLAFTRPESAFSMWLDALRGFQRLAGAPGAGRGSWPGQDSAAGDSAVNRTVAFLEATPPSRLAAIRASELSAIGMQAAELSRSLARELGMSFRELHRVFVVRAISMQLISSDDHVSQLAYRFGYQHQSVRSRFQARAGQDASGIPEAGTRELILCFDSCQENCQVFGVVSGASGFYHEPSPEDKRCP